MTEPMSVSLLETGDGPDAADLWEQEQQERHPAFVDVYLSIGGWKARLMVWYENDWHPDGGMYEPCNTWFGQNTREAAVADARSWAAAEEVECRV